MRSAKMMGSRIIGRKIVKDMTTYNNGYIAGLQKALNIIKKDENGDLDFCIFQIDQEIENIKNDNKK